MRAWIMAAAALLSVAVPAGAQPGPVVDQPVAIPDSTGWTMTSATGRRYQLFAAWPKAPPPPAGWPVIYTLDANVMFATMVETVRSYGRTDPTRQAIVIGIGYPPGVEAGRERLFDMTFPAAAPPVGGPPMPPGGGADAFLDFIARDLKPEVARRFRVDPARQALFGHSLGGLFAGYALVERPALFDRWMLASPSVWFGDRWLLGAAAQRGFAGAVRAMPVKPRMSVTVGAYEQADDPDFVDPRAAQLMTLRQVDGARDLATALGKAPGVTPRFELLANENHGSVIPAAIARAVRFLFAPDRAAR